MYHLIAMPSTAVLVEHQKQLVVIGFARQEDKVEKAKKTLLKNIY